MGGGRGEAQVEEGRRERERWSQGVQAWVDVYKRQGELGEGRGGREGTGGGEEGRYRPLCVSGESY